MTLSDHMRKAGYYTFQDHNHMWEELGLPYLDRGTAQTSWLRPNILVWSPKNLSTLQKAFARVVAPTPFIRYMPGPHHKDFDLLLHGNRHSINLTTYEISRENDRSLQVSSLIVGSFASRLNAQYSATNAGPAVEHAVASIRDILLNADIISHPQETEKAIDRAALRLITDLRHG